MAIQRIIELRKLLRRRIRVILKEIIMTCAACPSQWEGVTISGQPVYIRYRFGYLSVKIGSIGSDVMSAVTGDEIYGQQIGDEYDGSIDWDTVATYTGLALRIQKAG